MEKLQKKNIGIEGNGNFELENLQIGVGQQDIESQATSLNQGLLDEQFSNGVSQSAFELPEESTDIRSVKEAIIDLYLAIKIRSTDELDQINDDNLADEK